MFAIEDEPVKRLLSLKSYSRPEPDHGTRVVEINDQAAGEVFETLSSETTRDVLTAIYDNPGTASEIAEAVDTSLQNVRYHLMKLQEARLIEVADTWYSEQGNEMKVYAPTNESVVMIAGDETTRSSIRESLSRLLGTVAVLGFCSLIIDHLLFVRSATYWQGQSRSSPGWPPMIDAGPFVSPGSLFFLGGMGAIAIVVILSGFLE